jgi:O-antigen/teichoic acid export membrane protein
VRAKGLPLKQRAVSATFWSGSEIFLRLGLQFGMSIVLARLLSPEDFGTVALLWMFTGIANVFVALMTMSALRALVFAGVCWLFKLDALYNLIELLRGRKPEAA